jgi:diguanylate cyclase (GGDEF)-like protein
VGGDEFMIVLPETNALGANRVAQKLHEAFTRFPVATHSGPVNFTASIGVTAVDAGHDARDSSKIEDLLRAADSGLYASKRLGGNQVTTESVTRLRPKMKGRNTGGKNGIN